MSNDQTDGESNQEMPQQEENAAAEAAFPSHFLLVLERRWRRT